MIDNQVTGEHHPTPDPPNAAASSQIHIPTIVETLTTGEGAHNHTVPFTTCVSTVEGPIRDSFISNPRGSHFPDLDDRGPCTSLQPLILECEPQNHPNKAFVKQLLSDIRHECDIGYSGPQFAHTATNLQSAFPQPSVLDDATASECSFNRVLGPFDSLPLPNLRCSGLGLVSKQDGSWRTIYHLSAPPGKSINDFINPDTYALSYCSVDNAFAIVNLLGPGTLLSKIRMHFVSYQLDRQTGIYSAYFGKESITLTHACLFACTPPPASLIA